MEELSIFELEIIKASLKLYKIHMSPSVNQLKAIDNILQRIKEVMK